MMCIRPLTLILPLLLTACSGSQTSVERNASHAASAIERMHFDPNRGPFGKREILYVKANICTAEGQAGTKVV